MSYLFGTGFDVVFDTEIENGDYDGISYASNVFGGNDIYDDDIHVGHSEENIFGGEDYYDDNHQLIVRTQDNGIGGEYIYSQEGFEGTLVQNDVGDDIFYGGDGLVEHLDFVDYGNGSAIMQFDDPLAHVSSYIMPDLIL